MSWVPMPEHLKSKYGDTKVLRDYFKKHVVYFPVKHNLSPAQQHMVRTHFMDTCRKYMEYINEDKAKRAAPDGSVEDVSKV